MAATSITTPGSARPKRVSSRIAAQMYAFADSRALSRAELLAAPLRWPRPERLREPLELSGAKLAEGMRTLGVSTVGELLEHLPRDSREARTVAELRDGEQATVAVQVRAITSRPVRRRGMRPLVEARVFDATGSMRATFFNQPWLVERYPPGTGLLLHGKADARGGFRVSHHALGAQQLPGAGGESSAGTGESATQGAATATPHQKVRPDAAAAVRSGCAPDSGLATIRSSSLHGRGIRAHVTGIGTLRDDARTRPRDRVRTSGARCRRKAHGSDSRVANLVRPVAPPWCQALACASNARCFAVRRCVA